MTTPDSITVSLEWAKKLKEAAYPQSSVFKWVELSDSQFVLWAKPDYERAMKSDEEFDGFHGWNIVATAPTAEEILRRLPPEMTTPELKHTGYFLEIERVERRSESWQVHYRERDSWRLWDDPEPFSADTLANAAAAMWIYLKEHSLLP